MRKRSIISAIFHNCYVARIAIQSTEQSFKSIVSRQSVHAIKRVRLTADRNCLTNGRLHLNRSGTFDVNALMCVDHH